MYNLQTITIALHRLRDWLQLAHLLQRHTQLPLNFPSLDCPQDLKTALLDIPTPQSIPLPLINSVEETETLLQWLQTFDLQTSLALYSESSPEPLTLSFLTTTNLHMGLPYNDRKILNKTTVQSAYVLINNHLAWNDLKVNLTLQAPTYLNTPRLSASLLPEPVVKGNSFLAWMDYVIAPPAPFFTETEKAVLRLMWHHAHCPKEINVDSAIQQLYDETIETVSTLSTLQQTLQQQQIPYSLDDRPPTPLEAPEPPDNTPLHLLCSRSLYLHGSPALNNAELYLQPRGIEISLLSQHQTFPLLPSSVPLISDLLQNELTQYQLSQLSC